MTQILNMFVDSQELTNYEDIILQREDQILIPKNSISIGNKLTVVYNEENTERKEVTMLSVDHKRVYKNLSLEVEIEFLKKTKLYEQSFELIVRAISKWDKTYTVDEYYVFGLKGDSFYFAKVAYHQEEVNSFPYKILYNLNTNSEEITQFFASLNEDSRNLLFLEDFTLKYETKYKLRCEIIDNIISMKIKDTSKVESYETKFPWVTIFENVNINQDESTISKRTSDLVTTVGVSEPNALIDGAGLFGFTVPNSHVKIYRFEVTPLDKNFDINLFNDEQYSRNISTDFSNFYRTKEGLRLNSADPTREISKNFREYDDVIGDSIDISDKIITEDIRKIQINGVEVNVDIHYEDKFIDIISPMSDKHNGSILKAYIDDEDKNIFGENEKFFPLEEYTDGVSFEYSIDEEIFQKIKYFPNGKLGHVLLEVDNDIVLDEFNKVGLQKNPAKFITNDILEEQYAGRKFFLETTFRGTKRFFELGALGNGRFTFDIDDYFASANDSYEAIWKFNLANFIDDFLSQYSTISYVESLSGTIIQEFSFTETTNVIDYDYKQYSDSFGYVMSTMDINDIAILSTKTILQVTPEFNARDHELDTDVVGMIKKGVPVDHIRLVLGVYQNIKLEVFREILNRAIIKDKSFEVTLNNIVNLYGGYHFNEYKEARALWMEALDHNSHITTGGLESRVYYVSEDERKISINETDKTVVFVDTPPANRKIVVRVFFDNQITVTRSYNSLDTYYRVDDGIKKLYDATNTTNGVVELLEYYSPDKYSITETGGVPFVIVPKELNENDNLLYADVEICTSFVEKTEGVRRKAKAPLIKVSELLKTDFDSSIFNDIYLPTFTMDISAAPSGTSFWNREDDFFDTKIEFISGSDYEYDFPKMFPIPAGSIYEEYFDANNLPIETNEFFQKLLTGKTVSNSIIDQYLNVNSWYNVNNSKLGDYYKKVLQQIIDIKSLNRYYTNKQIINEDTQDPLVLGNWFDGFYSGQLTTWETSISGNDFGARYKGNPWGTQNSRKQMIEQLRDTILNKFNQFEIYFIDYTKLKYYQTYNTTAIFDSKYWDTDVYSATGNNRLIDNPYIDSRIANYEMGITIMNETNEEILFYADDFSFHTNNIFEYPEETLEAYGNNSKSSFKVHDIVRPIQNGVDMYWGFNTSIMFSNDKGIILPNRVKISAEYQYAMDKKYEPRNIPSANIQISHLGESNGTDFQKFPNPNVITYKNITNAIVHRIWLDNYIVNDFTVFDLGNKGARIAFNKLPQGFDMKKDVAIQYNVNNYYKLKKENILQDNFSDRRELVWIDITRDKKGYLKKVNPYIGYIVDTEKIGSESLYRLNDFGLENGEVPFKTASTANSTDLIKPIQYGQDLEDIISILTLRRNNNFEVSVDVIFDDDIERDLMQTDIIFRGKFNNRDGTQFFNENYSITIGLENSSIALVARSVNEFGVQRTQLLANVRGLTSTIKRNKFYTVKFRLIGNTISLYFNERNQEEKFYFSYNLKTGHKSDGAESVAEALLKGLGVTYENPNFYIDGDRIGLKSLSPKTNFSNFKLTLFEENNFKFSNTFEVVNFDNIISTLKKQYGISGEFTKLKRTSSGYEYIQIGNTLLAKQNGGTYVMHSMVVDDFDVIGEFVYVKERYIGTSKFEIINVYKDTLKLIDNIVVDGKQFIDEPILSYQVDSSRIVTNIENINGKLFITTSKSCIFVKVWSGFDGCVWNDVTSVWDIYG